MRVDTTTAANIKAAEGVYRAADVARHYGVHKSTITRIWNGQHHADVQAASDYPDFYARPSAGGLAEEVQERLSRGDSIKHIAEDLDISVRWVYQLRGIFN